jgi:hypothetical protein
VTAEVNVSDIVVAEAKVNPTSNCVAPQVEVLTYKNGVLGDEPFYVVLYR